MTSLTHPNPDLNKFTRQNRAQEKAMNFIQKLSRITRQSITRGATIAALALAPVLSAQAAVTIDQSPLILQQPLAPNIVLMLDDSGSMGWDYMPDTASGTNSATNGTYFNPNITYTPPKTALGTNYPNASFPDAWINGFKQSDGVQNIQFYTGSYDYYDYKYVGGSITTCSSSYPGYNCAFTYTDPTTGTQKYIAQDCSGFTNCTTDPVQQQNVANWFSYYHTRILMAKTGLTLAFSTLDPDFRVGFSSINSHGASWIKSNLSYTTKNGKTIADVEEWGDGTTGTQKANFWTWLIDKEYASGGTPLRPSLKAVGEYYKTSQPWQTSSTDTTEYACRPSYTILTTDGFWNGSDPGVGNVDGNDGPQITTPSPYQYLTTAPYLDTYSNTLADVAMYYWEHDLRTSVDNEVPTTPNDPAFWQHMTTFTMGLGWDPTDLIRTKSGDANLTVPQIFDWARSGNPPAGSSLTSTSNIWPKPKSNSLNNIADLAHAAVNGHGDFFSAKNPQDFVNGLKAALAAIADRQGAGSAITNSSNTLPTTSSSTDPFFRFRATYTTGQWTGTLTASTYDTSTTPPSYSPAWSTNSLSASFSPVSGVSLSNRNVWSTKTGSGGNGSVAFRKASDLTSAQQTGLGAYSVSTIDAQTMLNYLLGDSTYAVGNPGGTLRARKALLGDVVSSTPVYVAKPDPLLYANATFAGMTGTKSYANFVTSEASRAPMVYVAANDGMLHAFRVTAGSGYQRSGSTVNTVSSQAAGTEVYAYMPSAVLTQTGAASITNLANPQYGVVNAVDGTQPVPHQYYNDGRITTQNVYFGNAWHTVLVGTTGRGPAKAIYALDITDPTVLMDPSKAKNALLWERSAGDGKTGSNYIGEITGTPVIAQIKQGGTTSWAVFIGNGYNSAANTPALLQFDLQTGSLSVHTAGTTANDGLAEPGLMQSNTADGISTYAFAGDLNGNLWKFDLSSSTSAGTVAFIAKDPSGNTQPITSLVSIAYDSTTNSTFALFGTGKYLTQDDTKDKQVQTWYGVRVGMGADLAGTTSTTYPLASSSTPRADLTQRYAFDNTTTGDRATSLQDGNDMNNKAGWFMDLPQSGERIVNRTQFIGGKAVVSTLIPKVDDPCNTVPAGAVMGVDPFTGANQASDYGLGTTIITVNGVQQTVAINGKVFASGPAAGVTAVTNPDGTVSISFNTMGGGLASLGPIKFGGSAAARLSWRELTN